MVALLGEVAEDNIIVTNHVDVMNHVDVLPVIDSVPVTTAPSPVVIAPLDNISPLSPVCSPSTSLLSYFIHF